MEAGVSRRRLVDGADHGAGDAGERVDANPGLPPQTASVKRQYQGPKKQQGLTEDAKIGEVVDRRH